MTAIANTIEKYINNSVDSKKNSFAIVPAKNSLYFCQYGKAEGVLSLYVSMDFGSGMTEITAYDKYISGDTIPAIRIVGKEEETLICASKDFGYQLIGFEPEKTDEAEDKEHVHQAKNIFVYCRTCFYHTFIFADTEHSNIRVIEELARVDENGAACPDAVTTCMVNFFAHKKEQPEAEPSESIEAEEVANLG